MVDDLRKVCFVVMGFGNKMDYESGRMLDLDATYEAIIRPAVELAELRCVRADEIMHTGMIDLPMYEMLLRADLVIADISTGNVNAVYELGVRHALRPRSTIIMKESAGKLSFDLNHVSTLTYEHLGQDIGNREARRASGALQKLIAAVMAEQKADSPVYTFLPALRQPSLSEQKFEAMVSAVEKLNEQLGAHLNAGATSMRDSRPTDAAVSFAAANKLKPNDSAIIQQLALATYKSQQPTEEAGLLAGIAVLSELDPDRSNDPETLGIAGAMRKRLWLLQGDVGQLDAAIRYYGRGFELMRDYYNGENLATCYDFRAEVQADPSEAKYDRMSAQKVRKAVVDLLTEVMRAPSFEERKDQKWVHASMANCLFALGRAAEAEMHEKEFLAKLPAQLEIASYKEGRRAALKSAEQLM